LSFIYPWTTFEKGQLLTNTCITYNFLNVLVILLPNLQHQQQQQERTTIPVILEPMQSTSRLQKCQNEFFIKHVATKRIAHATTQDLRIRTMK
jgi:hypothetical protein